MTANELDEYLNDVDSYVEDGFGVSDGKEPGVDPFLDLTEDDKDKISKIAVDKDYEKWKKKANAKEWEIVYSKHPEWAIEEDEYDKILVNLLESYQEFKTKLNDM